MDLRFGTNTIGEGMNVSNVTKRRSTQTTAESQEILEMIDMYSKLSLDVEVDESGGPCVIEEENPSTKEFLQITTTLLRTLGEKLVEKLDQITFLEEENVLLKTSMKTEMSCMRDEIIDFKKYMCAKVLKERSSSSSSSISSSSPTTSRTSGRLKIQQTPPERTLGLEEEIKFLKYEIINKNGVIDYLMEARVRDHEHRSIIEDEDDDDNEDEGDMDTPNIEEELVHDCTIEIVERLLVNQPAESTVLNEDTKQEETSNAEQTVLEKTELSMEDVREHSFQASQNDLISKRVDDIEKIVEDLRKNAGTTHENGMSSVAPWDNNGNGFASNYMRKNGHQPGKGLGKAANGIAVPIRAEKKTFQPETPPNVWPPGTVLIAGDSMVGGLEGAKMSRVGKVQVRSHGGATIRDMHDHLNAILRKKPSHLIIHAHSNDASNRNMTSDDLYDGLMDLKSFAESKVANLKVTTPSQTPSRFN